MQDASDAFADATTPAIHCLRGLCFAGPLSSDAWPEPALLHEVSSPASFDCASMSFIMKLLNVVARELCLGTDSWDVTTKST
jgi:hypothetical protein